jgi:glycosyltransferase involved in cell wall biosynthesis
MYRGDESQLYVDQIIYELNSTLADGTLYQSEWSRRANLDLGKKPTLFTQTVLNAPDCDIFYPAKYTKNLTNQKVKIIASSFSNHPNKGFATYHWLDQNLDFSRFEITFVGNTPTQFQNIKHIPAVKPSELADLLRDNDIYVTASQKDPCSNALIEALHCGLPAIALRDGGHPEIVGAAGELFDTAEEIPDLLTRIASNYEQYSDRTHLPDIAEAAEQYQAFIGRIIEEVKTEKYQPKKLSLIGFLYRYNYYRISLLLRILKSRIINLFKANK